MKKKKGFLWLILLTMLTTVLSGAAGGSAASTPKQEDKPLTLYLVRHGETLFNVQGRMQGWSDSPLTEEGIKIAQSLARGLKDVPFTAAYSSTSGRAVDTASIALAGRNMKLNKDKRLREMNFGTWEGEYSKTLLQAHPDLYTNPTIYTTVGGESQDELFARTQAALDDIVAANKKKGGNIFILSHGMTILNYVLKLDPSSYDPMKQGGLKNASVTKVQWANGKFKVLSVGDTSYAEKGKQKLTLYLVRHGETLFNVQGRMQGYSDSPLTDEGIHVAQKLGKGLAQIPFTAAYSSTSERASDTAAIILEGRKLALQTDKALREMNFGTWEGEYTKELLAANPDMFTNPDIFKSVDGETRAELVARAQAAMNRIVAADKDKGGNVLVVSHGITILFYILSLDPNAWDISKGGLPNSSVTTVEWEDGHFKVVKVGDTSYTAS